MHNFLRGVLALKTNVHIIYLLLVVEVLQPLQINQVLIPLIKNVFFSKPHMISLPTFLLRILSRIKTQMQVLPCILYISCNIKTNGEADISVHSFLLQYTDKTRSERPACFISREGTSVSNGPVVGRADPAWRGRQRYLTLPKVNMCPLVTYQVK